MSLRFFEKQKLSELLGCVCSIMENNLIIDCSYVYLKIRFIDHFSSYGAEEQIINAYMSLKYYLEHGKNNTRFYETELLEIIKV